MVATAEDTKGQGLSILDYQAPLFIAWQINSECNLGCLHCCEEAGLSFPDEMNKEEVFKFCQEIVDLKIPYVAFSGGEPMLHPHLFEMCEFIRSHGIALKIETNGEFIDQQTATKLANLKLRSVQVSLDGATKEAHEKLRISGDWQKATDALRLLIDQGVNAELVFVPTKFNVHEIGDLIELAYSLGVYGVYTGKIMRIGRAAQNWDKLCPTDAEYETFFSALKEKVIKYEGKMKIYYYPDDVIEELKYRLDFPAASLLVIPNGKVKLIGPLPFICGDVRKQSLSEVWKNYQKAWKDPRVIEFSKRVVADQTLLGQANKWIEL